MQCPTVKVVSDISDENPHGYIVINESDLSEGHTVFVESDLAESDNEPKTKRQYTKKADK